MKKILITYDSGTALRDINLIKTKVIPYIETEILPIFKELDLGPMDKETLEDLVKSGGVKVEANLIKNIEGQLNKAGIKSRSLRANMITEALEPMERLRHAVAIEPVYLPSYFPQVSFEKGKPVLTDTDKEVIEERNKMYVTTEEGNSLRDLHLKAVTSVNDFLNVLQQSEKLKFVSNGQYLSIVFKIKDGDIITVDPSDLNYDAIAAAQGFKSRDHKSKVDSTEIINEPIAS